jgi:hypothetical protein
MSRLTRVKTLGIVVLLWTAIGQAQSTDPAVRAEEAARRAEAAATRSEDAARRVEAAAERLERLVEKLEQSGRGKRGSADGQ